MRVGRFVFRGCDEDDGLIVGAAMKGANFFKRNAVYEIREILGEQTIHEVGESIVRHVGEESPNSCPLTWGSSVNELLVELGPDLVLTREEYEGVLYQRRRQALIREHGADRVAEWERQGRDLNEIS